MSTRSKRDPKLVRFVRDRDRNICQCCGYVFLRIEAHHIHPLVLGGEDSLNNMISLCSLCHKWAPNNPDEFLEYQKNGGARWMEVARRLVNELVVQGESVDGAEIDRVMQLNRLSSFGLAAFSVDKNCPDWLDELQGEIMALDAPKPPKQLSFW